MLIPWYGEDDSRVIVDKRGYREMVDKSKRQGKEITRLKESIRTIRSKCQHDWRRWSYSFEIRREKSRNGRFVWFKYPIWRRTCKICGKVETEAREGTVRKKTRTSGRWE